jgi:replicative DNA helicase
MTSAPTPVHLEAERAVLGSLLAGADGWPPEVELLRAADFADRYHCNVFAAARRLHNCGEPVDVITVLGELGDKIAPPGQGWGTYLSGLSDGGLISLGNLGHHAKLVARESRRREYLAVMADAVNKAKVAGADADEIATQASLKLGRIAEQREIARPEPMREVMRAELRDLDERRNSGKSVGHPTGFDALDELVCGLVPGHLVVVAGRPSMGKSSFARNVLVHLAKQGHGCIFFSLEMTKDEIGRAAVSSESRVNLQSIRTGDLCTSEYDRVVEGMAALHSDKLVLVDRPALSVAEIRTITRAYAARHELDVVAVDYLQLATGEGSNREQEIASITRGLKALAVELKIAVVALSQLNRGLESRTDKRPRLADLRESGSIEQDADEVVFLYRDEYYNPNTEQKDTAEVALGKSRNGPVGMVLLKWLGWCTRFENL